MDPDLGYFLDGIWAGNWTGRSCWCWIHWQLVNWKDTSGVKYAAHCVPDEVTRASIYEYVMYTGRYCYHSRSACHERCCCSSSICMLMSPPNRLCCFTSTASLFPFLQGNARNVTNSVSTVCCPALSPQPRYSNDPRLIARKLWSSRHYIGRGC